MNASLINISQKLISVSTLVELLLKEEIEFEPRKYYWYERQQIEFIESILLQLPLPALWFDKSNSETIVVDGIQRILTIKNFIIDKTLKISNFEFFTQLNGQKYDDLDSSLQRIINETQFVTYVINPGVPENVKHSIVYRINPKLC